MNWIKTTGLILILVISIEAVADELKVVKFQKDEKCLDARINKYQRLDDNDEACAIIKIRTSISNLKFSAYPAIVGDVPFIKGEYWIYVSAGTRQISFFGENITKLDYNINEYIESKVVYQIEVKLLVEDTDDLLNSMGNLYIITNPPGAHVKLNSIATGSFTPFQYSPVKGMYHINLSLPGYQLIDTTIDIHPNDLKYLSIALKPNIKQHSDNNSIKKTIKIRLEKNIYPRLFVDGKQINIVDQDFTLLMTHGRHEISILADCYKPLDTIIEVTSDMNLDLSPINVCGNLTLTTQPSAAIFVDNAKKGFGHLEMSLFSGYHVIESEGEGLSKYKQVVLVKPHQNNRITMQLKDLLASVGLQSLPSKADVYMNDSLVGTTPLLIGRLEKGDYNFVLKKNGFGTETHRLTVDYPTTYSISKTMEIGRKIIIETEPTGASVFNSNILIGISPITIELPLRIADLMAKKDGYPDYRDSIDIKTCEANISLNLTYTDKGPEMVFVKGGCCSRHYGRTEFSVCVSDFYISKYEVTNEEFCYYLNDILRTDSLKEIILANRTYGRFIVYNEASTQYEVNSGQEKKPINYVSWFDAQNYCKWQGGRLPTEAEWQFAAEGGVETGLNYSGGDNIELVGWIDKNSSEQLQDIGKLNPNKLGLYDFTGNVNEWCYDWFSDDYYINCPDQNPKGPKKGYYRAVRGGSFNDKKKECTMEFRRYAEPNKRREDIGFRLLKLNF